MNTEIRISELSLGPLGHILERACVEVTVGILVTRAARRCARDLFCQAIELEDDP